MTVKFKVNDYFIEVDDVSDAALLFKELLFHGVPQQLEQRVKVSQPGNDADARTHDALEALHSLADDDFVGAVVELVQRRSENIATTRRIAALLDLEIKHREKIAKEHTETKKETQ